MAFQPIKSNRRGGRYSIESQSAKEFFQERAGRGLEEQLGPDSVVVGGVHPLTGAKIETPQGQAFDIQKEYRKKAVTDAATAIGQLRKIAPIIDEFESDFVRAFPNPSSRIGLPAKIAAGTTIFNARTLNNDPEFAAAIESLEGKRSQITKGLGEVGNLAEQEQKVAMQNVPELKFGGLGDLFLPEAPAVGMSKLKRFRKFIDTQIEKNIDVINAGGALENLPTSRSPIPGSPGFQQRPSTDISLLRQQAIDSINRGAPGRLVRDRFKQMTGQEL